MNKAPPGEPAFSAAWLDLRSAPDTAARDQRLELQLKRLLAGTQRPLQVIDLGCGNGANLRHLAPRLGGHQSWELVDNDAHLLRSADDRLRSWAAAKGYAAHGYQPRQLHLPGKRVTVSYREADICNLRNAWMGADLLTASALIDLVSARWLNDLIRRATNSGRIIFFPLAYNGRWEWSDPDSLDAEISLYFIAYHRRDKGFGKALGPVAVPYLAMRLRSKGYRVAIASSPWQVAPHSELRNQLLAGVRAVLRRSNAHNKRALARWITRRENSDAVLTLGHFDLLAWPRSRRCRARFEQ